MLVVPGPASSELGERVASALNVGTVGVHHKVFPDGESYIRLEGSVDGETVAIVQTLAPPQDTNLLQLLLLADAAKDLGARRVVAVVPYLAYARQDKRFLSGEAVSINTVIRLLEAVGVDRLITVNIHEEDILRRFSVRAESLSAMRLLAEHFLERGLKGAFSLAPDEGALDLAKEAAEVLGGGYGWLRKERDRVTGEISVEEREFNVSGKDVVIFDDIISTGGTMAAAARMLKAQGARRVYAACAHPLLVGDAHRRLLEAGCAGVVGTDCIPSPVSVVSVAPIIAEALRDEI